MLSEILSDKKCQDILTIDVQDKSSIANTIIIGSCTSNRHLWSVADHLRKTYRKKCTVDGNADTGWVVVLIEDILIHLFKPEIREHYNLEELYDGFKNH